MKLLNQLVIPDDPEMCDNLFKIGEEATIFINPCDLYLRGG